MIILNCSSSPTWQLAIRDVMGEMALYGLAFGLRHAPKLYNTVANALLWILGRSNDVEVSHNYLDNFLLFGAPESGQCEQALV